MKVESWLNDPNNFPPDEEFYTKAEKKIHKGYTIYHTATQLIILEKPSVQINSKKTAKNKTIKKKNPINYSTSNSNSQSSQKTPQKIKETRTSRIFQKKNDLYQHTNFNSTNFPNYVEIERLARRINRILNMEIIF
jgi:hypothetical protein